MGLRPLSVEDATIGKDGEIASPASGGLAMTPLGIK